MTKNLLISAILAVIVITTAAIMIGSVQAEQGLTLAPEEDSFAYIPMIIGNPAPPPSESYVDDFEEGIDPWKAVRWNDGSEYEIKYNDYNNGCTDGHCNFMEVEVKSGQSYVLVSPLEAVEAPFAYKVGTRAKLVNRDDGDAFSIIFGGEWTSNGCPAADFSTCFTKYYEFRVRYRDVNGDEYLEWKLKKVEGHDSNNQNIGPDIIDWKRLDGVDADSWVNWEVEVHNNGQMYIFANNVQQPSSAKDSTYIRNHYFGLMGRSGNNGGSHVLFDRMRIE